VTISRRTFLRIGGLVLAGPALASGAGEVEEVHMVGNQNGSVVRFAPRGLLVAPGTTIRWRNTDAGNSHTSTAFHPQNFDHPLRIPAAARPWNSDYLLPDQSFDVLLTVPGVYDYFCIPHEMAGMVGRIVVATKDMPAPVAAKGMVSLFPPVADIIKFTRVDP
jgi:plastocyanin